jgi:hypothetical protein
MTGVAAGSTAAMPDEPRRSIVRAHIERIAERGGHDADRFAAALARRCWPGGPADRTDPAAIEWVRRWGAGAGRVPEPAVCGCAAGLCRVCN